MTVRRRTLGGPVLVRSRTWPVRTLVMGILNLDAGLVFGRRIRAASGLEAAVAQAEALVAAGADILDVAVRAPCPGHEPVSEAVERDASCRCWSAWPSHLGADLDRHPQGRRGRGRARRWRQHRQRRERPDLRSAPRRGRAQRRRRPHRRALAPTPRLIESEPTD